MMLYIAFSLKKKIFEINYQHFLDYRVCFYSQLNHSGIEGYGYLFKASVVHKKSYSLHTVSSGMME